MSNESKQYRSPEEMRDDPLDEKIDIYSFGNNIYGILTGLWVFYENDDDGVVQVRALLLYVSLVDFVNSCLIAPRLFLKFMCRAR